MSSPSETASAHQAVAQDDQNRPEPSWDPASTIPEGDPRSPAPAASGYQGRYHRGQRHGAAAEPGLAGRDDAAAPFASSASPAAPEPAPAVPAATDCTSRSIRW